MRQRRIYEELLEALRQPKPRSVPRRFEYANPIAVLFATLGAIFVVVMLVALSFGMVSLGAGEPPITRVLNLALLVIPLVFLVYGLINVRSCRKYFTHGDMLRGRVVAVRTTGARMNARTFFRVEVQFCSPNEGYRAYDIVDNFSMEYFVDARDNDTEVDLLFLPSSPKKVLLVYNVATMRRFD